MLYWPSVVPEIYICLGWNGVRTQIFGTISVMFLFQESWHISKHFVGVSSSRAWLYYLVHSVCLETAALPFGKRLWSFVWVSQAQMGIEARWSLSLLVCLNHELYNYLGPADWTSSVGPSGLSLPHDGLSDTVFRSALAVISLCSDHLLSFSFGFIFC